MLTERGHIFVATARQTNDHALPWILAGPAASARKSVSGLQRRQDSFERGALVQRIESLIV
jgi:hypothetical protein